MKSILLTFLLLSLVACVPKVPKMPVSDEPVAVAVNLQEPSSLVLTSPSSNLSNQQVAEIQVFDVYPGAYVNLYTDPSCTQQIAGAKADDVTIKLRTPTLADGTYNFYAQQHLDRVNVSTCSLAHVTYTVETVKPAMPTSVDLSAPSVSPSNETMVNLVVTGAEIGATVNLYRDSSCLLQIDSKVATTTDVTFLASTTTDGNYLFYARQVDMAGNYSACSADYALYRKDTVALKPSKVSLFDPASAHSEDPSPELIIEGVEFGANVTLYTDASCTASVVSGVATSSSIHLTTPDFPLGNYYFYAKQVDAVGNESPCSTSYLYYTVAPPPPSALARKNPTVTPYNDNTLELTISGTTPNATIKLYKDQACLQEVTSGLATTTSLDLTTPVLTDGGYTFYARQYYSATVYSNCSTASVDYYVDTTSLPPSPLFLKIPDTNHDELATPTITASGIEVGSTIKLFKDAACTQEVASGVSTKTNIDLTVTAQPIGIYKFYAQQTDYLSNLSTCSTSFVDYMVKPPAPTSLTLISPAASPAIDSTATITVGGVISGADVTLFTDPFCNNAIGTAVASATTVDITTNTLPEASYTFYANQSFSSGVNFSDCSTATETYVRDISAKPPNDITLYSPAASPSDNTNPTFTVWGVENGATVSIYSDSTCSTQLGSAVSAGSSVNVTSTTVLTMGLTPIYAKQVDALGNISDCSTKYFNYEVTPPPPTSIVLKNPVTTPNTIQTVEVTVSGAENGSTVKIYTNDTCTSTVLAQGVVAAGNTIDLTMGPLPEGSYDFYTTQTLNTSNTSICSTATVNYTIDLTADAPTSITFPNGSPSEDDTPDVLVQPVEDGAFVEIFSDASCSTSLGSGTAVGTSITITSSSLAFGAHEIYAMQTDALGNVSPCSPNKGDYVVTPPAPSIITLVSPASSPGNQTDITINISPVEIGATVEMFYDSSCTVSVDSGVATATNIDLYDTGLTLNKSYQYYARQTILGFTSVCSSVYATYALDTQVAIPSALVLRAPRVSPDNDQTPEIEIFGVEYGATVELHKSAACDDLVGTTTEVIGTKNINHVVQIIVNTPLPIGSYNFYAKQTDAVGNVSDCSSATVSYQVVSPPSSPFILVPQNLPSFNTLPSAKYINDVAVDPNDPNRVVVATDFGVGISTDGGVTYVTRTTADGLRFNKVTKVYIDHRGYIFIGYNPRGASYSHDGGITFNTLNAVTTGFDGSQVVNDFYVHPLSNRIYIATNIGFYFSDNYGYSWSLRNNSNGLASNIINKIWQNPNAVDNTINSIIIVGTNGGICYDQTNAASGSQFKCVNSASPSGLVSDVVNDFSFGSNLIVFTDGGISTSNPFVDIETFSTVANGMFNRLYINGANYYAIINGTQLVTSSDSGATWSAVQLSDATRLAGNGSTVFATRPGTGLAKSTNPNVWNTNSTTSSLDQPTITQVKNIGSKLFFAASNRLYFTTDSGASYSSQAIATNSIVAFDVARNDDRIRYATTTGGEVRITTNASNYSTITTKSGVSGIACNDDGDYVQFGRSNSSRYYWSWDYGSSIFNTSTDSNRTYSYPLNGGDISYNNRTRSVSFGDGYFFHGANDGLHIYRRTNTGGNTIVEVEHWNYVNALPSDIVHDVYVTGNYIFVATDIGIAASFNGGNTWNSSQGTNLDGKNVLSIFYDSGTFYAGTNAGLYTATSITGSWTLHPLSEGLSSYIILDIGKDNNNKLFIATDQGLIRSR